MVLKINYDVLAAMAPNIMFAAVMLVIVIWGACAIRRDMKKLQQRRDEEIKRAEAMKLVPEVLGCVPVKKKDRKKKRVS